MLTLSIALSLLTSSPNFMAKNINSKPFDEGTLLKLDIFRKCFREWYPVFVHDPFTKYVCVFDMFAGSGYDSAKIKDRQSSFLMKQEALTDVTASAFSRLAIQSRYTSALMNSRRKNLQSFKKTQSNS